MKKILIAICLLFLLTNCSTRDIKVVRPPVPEQVAEYECVGAPIVDTSEILKNFVVVDTDKHKIKFNIPKTPVDVDLQKQQQHEFYRLGRTMSQDVMAMNNALLAMVLMRNMAFCDPENIKLGWETMKLFIRTVGVHYDDNQEQ